MAARTRKAGDGLLRGIGHRIARWLHARHPRYRPRTHVGIDRVRDALRPGDVLLVEGNERVSGAIKYLTQSTWSHAALFVGDALPLPGDGLPRPCLIEVNMHQGCVASRLENYDGFNLRICRPGALDDAGRDAVVAFMIGKLGTRYDLRNIFDLLRLLVPIPLPTRWRRRALALGSGDPTRAICSSLIAQAFQSLNYPILPEIMDGDIADRDGRKEILHIRHYSLYAPRDFDLSPYFEIVKPTVRDGFDYHNLVWG